MSNILLFPTTPMGLADSSPLEHFAHRCLIAAKRLRVAVEQMKLIASHLAVPAPLPLIQEGNWIISALLAPDQLITNSNRLGDDLVKRSSEFYLMVDDWVKNQINAYADRDAVLASSEWQGLEAPAVGA